MITIETLSRLVVGLDPAEVQRWIDNAWIRPDGEPGRYHFQDIDVARVRLIVQLRDDLGVDETALPVVLSLMDQLYETRRQMRRICTVIETSVPDDVRSTLLDQLSRR
jgi:chaperone modulatory protein CbpM